MTPLVEDTPAVTLRRTPAGEQMMLVMTLRSQMRRLPGHSTCDHPPSFPDRRRASGWRLWAPSSSTRVDPRTQGHTARQDVGCRRDGLEDCEVRNRAGSWRTASNSDPAQLTRLALKSTLHRHVFGLSRQTLYHSLPHTGPLFVLFAVGHAPIRYEVTVRRSR